MRWQTTRRSERLLRIKWAWTAPETCATRKREWVRVRVRMRMRVRVRFRVSEIGNVYRLQGLLHRGEDHPVLPREATVFPTRSFRGGRGLSWLGLASGLGAYRGIERGVKGLRWGWLPFGGWMVAMHSPDSAMYTLQIRK